MPISDSTHEPQKPSAAGMAPVLRHVRARRRNSAGRERIRTKKLPLERIVVGRRYQSRLKGVNVYENRHVVKRRDLLRRERSPYGIPYRTSKRHLTNNLGEKMPFDNRHRATGIYANYEQLGPLGLKRILHRRNDPRDWEKMSHGIKRRLIRRYSHDRDLRPFSRKRRVRRSKVSYGQKMVPIRVKRRVIRRYSAGKEIGPIATESAAPRRIRRVYHETPLSTKFRKSPSGKEKEKVARLKAAGNLDYGKGAARKRTKELMQDDVFESQKEDRDRHRKDVIMEHGKAVRADRMAKRRSGVGLEEDWLPEKFHDGRFRGRKKPSEPLKYRQREDLRRQGKDELARGRKRHENAERIRKRDVIEHERNAWFYDDVLDQRIRGRKKPSREEDRLREELWRQGKDELARGRKRHENAERIRKHDVIERERNAWFYDDVPDQRIRGRKKPSRLQEDRPREEYWRQGEDEHARGRKRHENAERIRKRDVIEHERNAWFDDDVLDQRIRGRKKPSREEDRLREELWRQGKDELARGRKRHENAERIRKQDVIERERNAWFYDDVPDQRIRGRKKPSRLQEDRLREELWRQGEDELAWGRKRQADGRNRTPKGHRKTFAAAPKRDYEYSEKSERFPVDARERMDRLRDEQLGREKEEDDTRLSHFIERGYGSPKHPEEIVSGSRDWQAEEAKRRRRERGETRKCQRDEKSVEEENKRRHLQREVEENWNLPQAEAERLRFQEEEDERLRRSLVEEGLARNRAANDPSVDLGATHISTWQTSGMRSEQFDHNEDSSTSIFFSDWEKPVSQDRIDFHVRKKINDYDELVEKLAKEAARERRDHRDLPDATRAEKSAKSARGTPLGYLEDEKEQDEERLHLQEEKDERLKSLLAEEGLTKDADADRELQKKRLLSSMRSSRPEDSAAAVTVYDSRQPVSEEKLGFNVAKKIKDYNEKVGEEEAKAEFGDMWRPPPSPRKERDLEPFKEVEAEDMGHTDADRLKQLQQKKDDQLSQLQDTQEEIRHLQERKNERQEEEIERLQSLQEEVNEGLRRVQEEAAKGEKDRGEEDGRKDDAGTYFDNKDLPEEDKIGYNVQKKRDDYNKMLRRKFGGSRQHKQDAEETSKLTSRALSVTYFDSEDFASPDEIGAHALKKRDDYEKMLRKKFGGMDDARVGGSKRPRHRIDEKGLGGPAASPVEYYDSEDLASQDEIGAHALKKRDDYEKMLRRKSRGTDDPRVGESRRPRHRIDEEGLGSPTASAVKYYNSEDLASQDEIGAHALKKRDDYEKMLRRKSRGTDDPRVGVSRRPRHHIDEEEAGGPAVPPMEYYDSEDLASQDEIGAHALKKRDDYEKMLRRKSRGTDDPRVGESRRPRHRIDEEGLGSPTASAVKYYNSEDLASQDEIGAHALKKRDDYEKMLRRKFRGTDDPRVGVSRRPRHHIDEEEAGGPAVPPMEYYDSEDLASQDEIGLHALKKRDDYEKMLSRKFRGSGRRREYDAREATPPRSLEEEEGLDGTEDHADAAKAKDPDIRTIPKAIWHDFKNLLQRKFGDRSGKKESTVEEAQDDDRSSRSEEETEGVSNLDVDRIRRLEEEAEASRDLDADPGIETDGAMPRKSRGKSDNSSAETYDPSHSLDSEDKQGKRDHKMLRRKYGKLWRSRVRDERRRREQDEGPVDEGREQDEGPVDEGHEPSVGSRESPYGDRYDETSAVPYYDSEDLASQDEIGYHVKRKKSDYEGMLRRKLGENSRNSQRRGRREELGSDETGLVLDAGERDFVEM